MKLSTAKTEFLSSIWIREAIRTRYSKKHWPRVRLSCPWPMLIFACVLVFADSARAATATFTNDTPTLGPNDISNLIGGTNGANNVDLGDQYIAGNQRV